MAVHNNSENISVDVIETIAAVTDTDPLTMEPPLFEVVDTDALDALFERQAEACVEFEYNGHSVVIESDRTVTVDGETEA